MQAYRPILVAFSGHRFLRFLHPNPFATSALHRGNGTAQVNLKTRKRFGVETLLDAGYEAPSPKQKNPPMNNFG